MTPFSDNRIAIFFVLSKLENTIIIMTVIGTESTIPTTPQITPQTQKKPPAS